MRITSGKYKGRVLISPKTRNTRPMTDKVRAALFDILGPIDGLAVLDTYAGTGALGFEALSRGAKNVVAVEVGKDACAAIAANKGLIGPELKYTLVPSALEKWLPMAKGKEFDIIFMLPPYAAFDIAIAASLGALLTDEGLMIIEYPARSEVLGVEGLEVIKKRTYGDVVLVFYRKVVQ